MTPPPSQEAGNATLASLTYGHSAFFDQPFQPEQSDYTATVGFLVSATFLFIEPADADAAVSVNGSPSSSGGSFLGYELQLEPGPNTVAIEITSIL